MHTLNTQAEDEQAAAPIAIVQELPPAPQSTYDTTPAQDPQELRSPAANQRESPSKGNVHSREAPPGLVPSPIPVCVRTHMHMWRDGSVSFMRGALHAPISGLNVSSSSKRGIDVSALQVYQRVAKRYIEYGDLHWVFLYSENG
jgi:hypothetical protein